MIFALDEWGRMVSKWIRDNKMELMEEMNRGGCVNCVGIIWGV